MKTKIEIILGFLESGKTSFINSMFLINKFSNETIVVIEDEFGQEDISCPKDKLINNNVKLIKIEHDTDNSINSIYINKIILMYMPDRIFIETNGMKNCNSLINIFNNPKMKRTCKLDDIISLIDGQKFHLYFTNMKELLTSQILNSNKIILNNLDKLNDNDFDNIQNDIKAINETADVLEYLAIDDESASRSLEKYCEIDNLYNNHNNSIFNFKIYIYIFLSLFILTILSAIYLSGSYHSIQFMIKIKNLYTIFISLLIEGLPFILIGSFVSALIQICISNKILTKLFPHNIFLSCIIAAFAGFILPICDCGTVPVVKGLIKKKVPIAACITFMLAAPIVNPIAIASTIYAFQGSKSVVIYRIAAGIFISISVGLIMHFLTKNDSNVIADNADNITQCECAVCNGKYNPSQSIADKIKTIFVHTGDEFFNVGKYMIMGAFLSCIFQTHIAEYCKAYLPDNNKISLIIMMLSAFFLSVCSTSDAFIAKGFLKSFSINSVMGFLIVGPMIDIKNTFMLLGNFKKTFVIKLIFFIIVISFIVLNNLNLNFQY